MTIKLSREHWEGNHDFIPTLSGIEVRSDDVLHEITLLPYYLIHIISAEPFTRFFVRVFMLGPISVL